MELMPRRVAAPMCSLLFLLALLPLCSLAADRKVVRAVAPTAGGIAHAPEGAAAPAAHAKAHSPTPAKGRPSPDNDTDTDKPAGTRAKAPVGADVPVTPQPISAASGGCSRGFKGATLAFQRCVTLDGQGNFKLAWSYSKDAAGAQTAKVLFEGVPEAPYGWAGWGISPTGAMTMSDALVGYGDANNASFAKARLYHLSGTTPKLVYPDMTTGLLSLAKRGMAVEIGNGGNTIRTLATIDLPPDAKAQVIWKAGVAADPATGALAPHSDPGPANRLIDFSDTGSTTTTLTTTPYVSNLSQKQVRCLQPPCPVGGLLCRSSQHVARSDQAFHGRLAWKDQPFHKLLSY